MKRIKIIRVLATYIYHDRFAYSPIWTWDGFPPIIYTERERILPVLKEWEHKGYLTLIYDEKIAFILNVEKLPSKEKLIEESRNIK
nr:acyl-phosphate glycerol 3-phosphate acyltransferase [uncultured Prevotella sp.]